MTWCGAPLPLWDMAGHGLSRDFGQTSKVGDGVEVLCKKKIQPTAL
jgi:hypothetical protein